MRIQAGINSRLGDYVITSDTRCYTLEKISKNGDKKSEKYGQEVHSFIGYYTSFKNVLRTIMEDEIRNSGATTIEELVRKVEQLEQDVLNQGSEMKLAYVCKECGEGIKNEQH
ncbi:MAG: hypothetical protein GX366_05185 [Epulopiscium sp.]|mgnify:CR=1 FL=1|nr:hypothetical protein [Candidatus Epulonipiscium sp.]